MPVHNSPSAFEVCYREIDLETGTLEVYDGLEAWMDWYEESNSAIDTPENRIDNPGGSAYTCYDRDALSEGCQIILHAEDYSSKKRARY